MHRENLLSIGHALTTVDGGRNGSKLTLVSRSWPNPPQKTEKTESFDKGLLERPSVLREMDGPALDVGFSMSIAGHEGGF